MRGNGDGAWALVGILFGAALAALVLLPFVAPEAGDALTWGLPLLVALAGSALALAAFVTARAEKKSRRGPGPEATAAAATAALPTAGAGASGTGGGAREEGSEMKDTEKVARLCARLRGTDIFEALTDDHLRLIAGIGKVRPVVAGARLADAGQRGDNLYVILEGQLRLLAPGGDGGVPVRVAQAGETVPLAAILDPPVLVTSVEAITDGEVLTIPRQQLLALCQDHPMLGLHLYRAAAKVFEQRYRKTLERLTGTLRQVLEFASAGAELAT